MRHGEYPPTVPPQEDAATSDDPTGAEADALRAMGFSKPFILRASEQARRNGTSIETELLHSGDIDEHAYYGTMARHLGLPFIAQIDPALVADIPGLDTQLRRPKQIRINHRNRAPQVVIAPEAARLADLKIALETMKQLCRDIAIAPPSAIRTAAWQAGAKRRTNETVSRLSTQFPHLSAKVVVTGKQGFRTGMAVTGLVAMLISSPFEMLSILHVFLSSVYLTSLALRFSALTQRRKRPLRRTTAVETGEPLPQYTVMVALYREASVAKQLVAALMRLDWPRSLLDIKLVCEADDDDTIKALKAEHLPPHFEIVEVPPGAPRTKPRALSYALEAARGEFLVIYDAEDRPHPYQLREAYHRFRSAPDNLVCLQAPLVITNAGESWISTLFSVEYSGLFRGLLPMLAAGQMPLPLGGTSNHFRTEALRAACGWDPFNVTEDADLGLRLHRMGFRADIIGCQTLEDAPTTRRVWMNQRSRWFKGWLQTWLVMMRNTRLLIREMGFAAFCIFQLTVGGMLLSSLLHPLILIFIGIGFYTAVAASFEVSIPSMILLLVDSLNIVASYVIFLRLGIGSMTLHEKTMLGWRWAMVPAYWMMTSVAAWRAALELRTNPFFWNKTPHKAASRSERVST